MALESDNGINENYSSNSINSLQKDTEQNIAQYFRISLFLSKNENKEMIISAIQNAINAIDNNNIYASGSEGNIYKIEIVDANGEKKDLLVAKKRFDNIPENEYKIHEKIQNLVGEGSMVQVPKLRGIFGSNGYSYIIMDFIKGKTLYHKIAEGIIEQKAKLLEANATGKSEVEKNIACQQANNLRNRIKYAKSDSDVDHIFLEGYEYNSKKADEAFYKEKSNIKIFGNKEGEKYKLELWNFLKAIHENGLYHRDLHEKNIIFGDDGKIYIIDFGKSIYLDPKKGKVSKQDIYEEQLGENIGVYSHDEDIVREIQGLTKTPDDEDIEALLKQNKEKNKKLTEGDMLIEKIDFSKIKSRKILNKIKKNFGGSEQLKMQVKNEGKYKYTIDSFLGINDKDLILSLFSMTNENLQDLLKYGILKSKSIIIKEIKDIRYHKLGEQSRINLFGIKDENIKIEDLVNTFNQMWDKKGYDHLYKKLDFLRDLKPMRDNSKRILQIEELKSYLEALNSAIS